MLVSIYVPEDELPELHHFLNSPVKYEHRVSFHLSPPIGLNGHVQVLLSYDEFVCLDDMEMSEAEPKDTSTINEK